MAATILCLEEDRRLLQVIEKEANFLDIALQFTTSIEDAKAHLEQRSFSAYLFNQIPIGTWQEKTPAISLICKELPSINELEKIKHNSNIKYVTGKPMTSEEAHYLLSKMCGLPNQYEPPCEWIYEIPKHLMDSYLKLSYQRLERVFDILQKIKSTCGPSDELQALLHKISGSSGMYGRLLASKICKEMEAQIKIKNIDQLDWDTFYRKLYLYIQ